MSTINDWVKDIVNWLGCDQRYARDLLDRALNDDFINTLLWENLHSLETEDDLEMDEKK